jgi:glucose 1-dehydrogenase
VTVLAPTTYLIFSYRNWSGCQFFEVAMNSRNNGDLSGQTAVVTGAGSGIGAAIAMKFAAAGAKVGVNYRGSDKAAVEIVERIQDSGGVAIAVKADVSSEADVRAMFAQLSEAFGRIDIMVANAGIQRDAATTDMTLDQWRSVLDTNLTGQFLCAREAIRRFIGQEPSTKSTASGKIICMNSVHGTIPWAGHVNYAASKGGLDMMMKSIAQEVAGKKIRVNVIAPGAIKTNINRQSWSTPEKADALLKLIPYGRIGDPEDIAKAALWLASDDSDYVTGTTLLIDGGMSLYPAFRDGG